MKFGTFRNAQAGSNAGPDSILQASSSQFMDTRLRTDHGRMQADTLQRHGVDTGSGSMTESKGPDFMEMNRGFCPDLKEELMWTTKNIDSAWLLHEQSFSGIAENTLKNATATQLELERLAQAQPNSQWAQMNKQPTELNDMLNSRHNPLAPGSSENRMTKNRSSMINKREILFSNHNSHEPVEEDAGVYCQIDKQRRPVIVPSKNLASERKRRKKLNDSLYLLRGLVPKISKLDKASIIGDAINYIKELHQEVQTIEEEIADKEKIRSSSMADEDSGGSDDSDSGVHQVGSEVTIANNPNAKPNAQIDNSVNGSSFDDSQGQSPAEVEQKMIEIEVEKLEEQTYLLRVFCQKEPGVLVKLLLSLESLNMTFLSASYTSLHESIMNTFIIEMKGTEIMDMEEVKKTITRAVAENGLRSVILTS